jgi:uncharacterized protein (DUF2225 family)
MTVHDNKYDNLYYIVYEFDSSYIFLQVRNPTKKTDNRNLLVFGGVISDLLDTKSRQACRRQGSRGARHGFIWGI